MKITKYDGARERLVLIGMITNARVLGAIAPLWTADGCFGGEVPNALGGLAVKFWQEHGEPPGIAIQNLFVAHVEHWHDKTKLDMGERLLESISDEYERSDELKPDYVLSVAQELFNEVRSRKVANMVLGHCDNGQIAKAVETLSGFNKVAIDATSRISFFKDKEKRAHWFAEANKSLIKYPGPLGQFFGPMLARHSLISLMAPDKTFKSFWLLDMAWRAVMQRRKVAFFEVGDLIESEAGLRFGARAAGKPTQSTNEDMSWPCIVKRPVAIKPPVSHDDFATAEYEELQFDHPLTKYELDEACEKIVQHKIRSLDDYLFIECHPNDSITANEIRTSLLRWQREENWSPDVVFVDYADILANPPGKDERHQINATWKSLKRIAQELHCLVVTATQTDADAYDRILISRKNFSEDKRKLAHVNGMLGVNLTPEEKERQICRLNWVVARGMASNWKRVIHVAQCIPLSQTAVVSCWSEKRKGGLHV